MTKMQTQGVIAALKDCIQSLKRLPDVDGAYRISCIQQAENALKTAGVKL